VAKGDAPAWLHHVTRATPKVFAGTNSETEAPWGTPLERVGADCRWSRCGRVGTRGRSRRCVRPGWTRARFVWIGRKALPCSSSTSRMWSRRSTASWTALGRLQHHGMRPL